LLNRYANFRRFERGIHDQARTFLAIIFFQWLVTLAVVSLLVHYGSPVLPARLVAVALNLPVGFLANRYLTFGVGIIPRMRGAWKTK
jgi:putative flippase GtrA